MAADTPPKYVTDNLFQMSVSCPLKFYHHWKREINKNSEISFRHRNKLLLRDAAVSGKKHLRFTSDDTETALKETKNWLTNPEVTICGAVFKVGNCITRIPALEKSGSSYTIIQVHGKLRKQGKKHVINSPGISRTIDTYLLKASFRLFVLKQAIEPGDYHVEFCFPSKSYRTAVDKLYKKVDPGGQVDINAVAEFEKLFATVRADNGVLRALERVPNNLAHKMFEGKSVKDIVAVISNWIEGSEGYKDVQIHEACKYCEFRTDKKSGQAGCWSQFFPEPNIREPGKQVFELIGHGNRYQSENGYLYQEQVPLPDSVEGFESVKKQSYHSITIQHRRILQLLAAKQKKVPEIWVKPGLNVLTSINYPVHFIDFEAATYAVPFKRGTGAYEQVYFQFSCHSLHKNGTIIHTEWLDDNPDTEYTNLSFADALIDIDDIFEGTIVQYSPFERQGINNLIRELGANSMLYGHIVDDLKKLRESGLGESKYRFLDVNKLIRDYYYNCFMEDKLSLKSVLQSILQWERTCSDNYSKKAKIADIPVNFLSDKVPNPYDQIQNGNYQVEGGSEAMDAWISLKNGRTNQTERQIIPTILKRYCALDSYAMFIIFDHLKKFVELEDDIDIVIFSEQ